jgi:hypothetical protein
MSNLFDLHDYLTREAKKLAQPKLKEEDLPWLREALLDDMSDSIAELNND